MVGMGGLTQLTADQIPKVDKVYMVTYVDHTDVMMECLDASIEGHTFMEGKKGEGTVAIDFDKIRTVFFKIKDNDLYGYLRLYDGSETVLSLNKEWKAFGRSKYGTYQIKLADLKKMVIAPQPVSGQSR